MICWRYGLLFKLYVSFGWPEHTVHKFFTTQTQYDKYSSCKTQDLKLLRELYVKELYNHIINATKNSFFANVMGVNNSKIFINYVIKHSFKTFLDQALHTYTTGW